MTVRKAVIPVAGFGTRFLPASRSVPKNLLPVLDTPAVHYAVEEAASAGIQHVVFVVSARQEAVNAYFGRSTDLETALKRKGNDRLLEQMLAIPRMAEISYVRQHEQLGLGHAILVSRSLVGREPFAVILPDDLIWSDSPTIAEMIRVFDKRKAPVIAVREAPPEQVPSLGIVDVGGSGGPVYEIKGLVEKPRLEDAPSNLGIVGRYVLPPEIFEALEETKPGALGEIQITDALATLPSRQGVYGYRFSGTHFDVGTPLGLLKASIHAALQRDDLASDLREWLAKVM